MFGWFSPRCPLGTWEKTWTETRMAWLARKLGLDRLRNARVVLPTEQDFPEPYKGSPRDARRMLERVCGYMGIDPGRIALKVCPDEEMADATGTYQREPGWHQAVIRVAQSQLADPEALVATLAHELAHEVLLGGGLLDVSVPDHESITDLLPVCLGLGVFAANATIREQCGQVGHWGWWTMARQGYLPSRMLGYALALFCLARDEKSPPWVGRLRGDAASALKNGLRYVEKTDDTLFRPEELTMAERPATPETVLASLAVGTPSARLAALWQIEDHALTGPACLQAVRSCLNDRDADVAGEAARVLSLFGRAAEPALPELLRGLHHPSEFVRAGAASALGELGIEKETTARELCGLLGEASADTVLAAAEALTRLGVLIDPRATDRLLGHLEKALIECEHPRAEVLAAAVLATTKDPNRRVEDYFHNRDKGLARQALKLLAQLRRITRTE